MRLALISDIHGNTAALDAVIADMNDLHPDVVICLGDIAAGGPDPGGAIDRVAEVATVVVQGNTDAGLVDMPAWWRDPGSIGLPDDAMPGMEVTVWTAERVTEEHRRFLADLPLTVEVDLGGYAGGAPVLAHAEYAVLSVAASSSMWKCARCRSTGRRWKPRSSGRECLEPTGGRDSER